MPAPCVREKAVHTHLPQIDKADQPDCIGHLDPRLDRACQKIGPARLESSQRRIAQHIDPQRLVGLASYRAAPAGIKEVIARCADQGRAQNRPHLQAPRKDKPFAQRAIAAQICSQPRAAVGDAKAQKRLDLGIQIEPAHRIGLAVAPVPRHPDGQRQILVNPCPHHIRHAGVFIAKARLRGQVVGKHLRQRQNGIKAIRHKVSLIQMAVIRPKTQSGVRREGCRPVQRQPKAIVDPAGLRADVQNFGAERKTFGPAKKVAVKPGTVQHQPVKAGNLGSEGIAARLFLDHGGGDAQEVGRGDSFILDQCHRFEDTGPAQSGCCTVDVLGREDLAFGQTGNLADAGLVHPVLPLDRQAAKAQTRACLDADLGRKRRRAMIGHKVLRPRLGLGMPNRAPAIHRSAHSGNDGTAFRHLAHSKPFGQHGIGGKRRDFRARKGKDRPRINLHRNPPDPVRRIE